MILDYTHIYDFEIYDQVSRRPLIQLGQFARFKMLFYVLFVPIDSVFEICRSTDSFSNLIDHLPPGNQCGNGKVDINGIFVRTSSK